MESGILDLHKQKVPILPFLDDCIKMFSAQAKECGITLSIINNSKYSDINGSSNSYNDRYSNGDSYADNQNNIVKIFNHNLGNADSLLSDKKKEWIHSPLNRNDDILIDKFKMDQVQQWIYNLF